MATNSRIPLLPLDVYHEILQYVSQSDLLNCRLAGAGGPVSGSGSEGEEETSHSVGLGGRLLAIAATAAAFRHVRLEMAYAPASVEAFRCIANHPQLRAYVREVTIDTWRIGDWRVEDEMTLAMECIEGLIASLHAGLTPQFNNLVSLHLRFDGQCNMLDKELQLCLDMARMVSESIAPSASVVPTADAICLRHLTVENLPSVSRSHGAFRRMLLVHRSSLRHLKLCMAREAVEPRYVNTVAKLPSVWLQPEVAVNLRVLSLYSPGPRYRWGWWPRMDRLRTVDLPNLCVLALGNYVFSHEWQVRWIAGLGREVGGLRELYLDLCPILWHARYPDNGSGEEDMATPNGNLHPIDNDTGEHGNAGAEEQDLSGYPPPGVQSTATWHVDDVVGRHYPLRWHLVFKYWRENMRGLKVFRMGYGQSGGEEYVERDESRAPDHITTDWREMEEGGSFRNYDMPYRGGDKEEKGVKTGMDTTARETVLMYTFFDTDLRFVSNSVVAKGYVDKDWSTKAIGMVEPGLEDFGLPADEGAEYDEEDVARTRYLKRKQLDEQGLLAMKRRFPFPGDPLH